MRDVIDKFLSEMLAQGRSPKTASTYRSGLYRFANEIGKPLGELQSRDIQEWLMGLSGIGPCRRHNIRCALSSFFAWCRRWEYLPVDKDIMFQVGNIKRPEKVMPWLSKVEVKKVAEKGCSKALKGFLKWKARALIKFLALTSMRLNEALTLRWNHIHYDKGYIDYTMKGGKQDIYALDNQLVELLKDYREKYDHWQRMAQRKKLNSTVECAKYDYVFPARTGKKWHHAYDAIRRAGEAVGVRIHPHMLRHSFAQWYVEDKGRIEGLQILMGHKRISTTQGYYHQHLNLKKRARKAVKFNI
jgi:integrase